MIIFILKYTRIGHFNLGFFFWMLRQRMFLCYNQATTRQTQYIYVCTNTIILALYTMNISAHIKLLVHSVPCT